MENPALRRCGAVGVGCGAAASNILRPWRLPGKRMSQGAVETEIKLTSQRQT
jgi:hypothetical protein